MPGLAAAVAAEVTRLLEERGWSGRELARRTGMTQPSVARKVSGETDWGLDDLEAVCAALDVDLLDLLRWARS